MIVLWNLFYVIIRFIAFLAQVLPITWAYSSFSAVFSLGYRLWPEKRRDTQDNVSRILGQSADSPAVHHMAELW